MKKIITLFLLLFPFSVFAEYFPKFPYLNAEKSSYKIENSKNLEIKELRSYMELLLHKNERKLFQEIEIPFFNPFIEKLGKQKVKDLAEKNILQIYGSGLTCEGNENECVFDRKNKFFTNTKFHKYYSINSEKDQKIDLIIYPISPDFFDYNNYSNIESGKTPKLTFFDPILEFYDSKIIFLDDKFEKGGEKKFEKNYKVIKNKDGNYSYIPYYKAEINLFEGKNNFLINYLTFTDLKDNGKSGEIIIFTK